MDRISSILPVTGWSVLTAAITQEQAPATTVEPVTAIAETAGGMSANIDTGTPEGRSATILAQLRAAAAQQTQPAIGTEERANTAPDPPPDPNAPSGPRPTFDISPLAARAAALSATQGYVVPILTRYDGMRAALPQEEAPLSSEAGASAKTATGPMATNTAVTGTAAAEANAAPAQTAKTNSRGEGMTSPAPVSAHWPVMDSPRISNVDMLR